MVDSEKVIEALHCRAYNDDFPCSICAYYRPDEKPVAKCDYQGLMDDTIALLKEQKELISNYKEIIDNLLQQLQDIEKYMTPYGMVSDVRAYIEGRSQPEIIRCYACKHRERCNSVYLCGKSRGFGIAHDPSWFCADGERNESR